MALRAKKYFRDYEIRETVSSNGRSQRELFYCGDWYVRVCSDKQRTAERWGYLISSVAAALLLLGAMLQRVEANISIPWAQAVSLLAMIPAFCVLEGSVEAFFRKGKLKKEEYRERILMLRIMGFIGAALNLALLVGYAMALASGTLTRETAVTVLFTSVNILIYFTIGIREVRVAYRVIKAQPRAQNSNDSEEDAKRYFD